MTWEELIDLAIARGASDVLVSPGSPPVLKIQGTLEAQPAGVMTGELARRIVEGLLTPDGLAAFRATGDHDFGVTLHGRRFRGNAFLRHGEPGLALRLFPAEIPTPDELGLPSILSDLVLAPSGLILVTGAAGQGKSTSQAALIRHLNERQTRHVVTIEDPIEYVHTPIQSVIDQREVGRDTRTFASGLRHVFRQAPDVILVGEMRDPETMDAALSVAETGHLVLSTVHASDAVQALARIVDAYPEPARDAVRTQLSRVVSAVVNQRLVVGVDGKRVLACEVLVNGPAVSAQIREGHFEQIYSTMEIEQRLGMQTLNHALEALVQEGKVHEKLARRYMVARESRVGRRT